jgi:hypothetical protein
MDDFGRLDGAEIQMAHGPNGAGQQGRRIPKGAEFQTSRNPKSREIPNCALTARSASARRSRASGIQRSLEFSALWNSAPFGIQRRLEFGAVWNSA